MLTVPVFVYLLQACAIYIVISTPCYVHRLRSPESIPFQIKSVHHRIIFCQWGPYVVETLCMFLALDLGIVGFDSLSRMGKSEDSCFRNEVICSVLRIKIKLDRLRADQHQNHRHQQHYIDSKHPLILLVKTNNYYIKKILIKIIIITNHINNPLHTKKTSSTYLYNLKKYCILIDLFSMIDNH